MGYYSNTNTLQLEESKNVLHIHLNICLHYGRYVNIRKQNEVIVTHHTLSTGSLFVKK